MKRVKYKMGKLGKYRFMKRFQSISSFLPDTRIATKANIKAMIRLYESLYLKPDTGTGGYGIYKIGKMKNGFSLRSGTASRHFPTIDALYRSIHSRLVQRPFVVQKGIAVLKHNDRAFDIRVMVQKNKHRQFIPTGIVGRLARPNKIVTNYHSGGTPLPVELLLQSHLKRDARKKYIQSIENLGKTASEVLAKSYKTKRAFGVDIAVDPRMKPWILEINTKPDMSIFNTLKDKTMYRRILSFARVTK
ncbi:YheC/YheD family protein [Paenibacillus doosanensis]|uniref:YheC/YheD family protein n=1 Tax=Paenibacillus doosanensis TaxID=1229154 RepID=UPI00217F5115|nr:YheC/YheD family protein [Paenibacillus doosanensis]